MIKLFFIKIYKQNENLKQKVVCLESGRMILTSFLTVLFLPGLPARLSVYQASSLQKDRSK